MKTENLIIIGNGFDLYFNMPTGYRDFEKYISDNYLKEKESIEEMYFNSQCENKTLWSDFEIDLANVDKEQILNWATNPEETKELYSYISECDKTIRELFESWIKNIDCVINTKYNKIIDNSFIINFNYTETFERNFGVPEDRIYHIHGKIGEPLVFGHKQGVSFPLREVAPYDMDIEDLECYNEYESFVTKFINSYLFRTEKPTDKVIQKSDCLLRNIYNIDFSKVNNIFVIGLSCSEIDIPYIKWLYGITNAKWHIGYHKRNDKKHLLEFIKSPVCFSENKKLIKMILK